MCYDMSFFSNIKLISDYLNIKSGETLNFEPTFHKVAQSFSKWPVVIKEDGNYKIKIFDSSQVVAAKLKSILIKENLLNNEIKNKRDQFLVTDWSVHFEKTTKLFYGEEIHLEKLSL